MKRSIALNAVGRGALMVVGLAIATRAAQSVSAQTTTPASAAPTAFEVASIRAMPPGTMPVAAGHYRPLLGGRFRGVGLTARGLIQIAFRTPTKGLQPSQIVGGPGWMATAQFDIEATVSDPSISGEAFEAELPVLMRSLLKERFAFESHLEQRPMPVYALVRLPGNQRLGPQLRPTSQTCDARPSTDAPSPPPRTPPPISTGRPTCSLRSLPGEIVAGGVTLDRIAGVLGLSGLDRAVKDMTGLTGRYDVDLRWAPDKQVPSVPGLDFAPGMDGPSLFTAIREQLGLRLEPRSDPADFLVVDHLDMPSPN